MTNKWVFRVLVKDNEDIEGLIAYGLYKVRKSELAKSLRENGEDEATIQLRIQGCHDEILASAYEQQQLKAASAALLNAFKETVKTQVTADTQTQITQIQQKHTDDLEKYKKAEEKRKKIAIANDREQWIKKVEKTQLQDHNILVKFFLYAWSGVPSAVATFVGYALFTFLLIVFFTKPENREAAFNEAATTGKEFLKIGNSSSSSQQSSTSNQRQN